jgi:hypothetical protein
MKKHHPPVPVPNPLPAPIPGGGPHTGYQFLFNQRYYDTREAPLAPFSYGLAASPNGGLTGLTGEELATLADGLYAQKIDFDQEIDFWQEDPYATMYLRSQVYGYQRVPVGTGTTAQPPVVLNPADLQGPPVPGQYLLVTCDINLL